MKQNNSKNLQIGDRVRHEHGYTGTVTNVEYTTHHVDLWTTDGRHYSSSDEVEVDWDSIQAAPRTSQIYLTKI